MIHINISPIAFWGIRWYGIFVALGVAIVVSWGIWQSGKKGAKFTGDGAITAALVGIPSGIVFSKIMHIIDNIVVAKVHPELAGITVTDYTQFPMLMFSGAGLTIEGAVLGAALGIFIYSRYSGFRFGAFTDAIAPAIILGQAVGRIGCLFNGCCYGISTSAPWGIIYTNPNSYAPLGISFHPTQLYEIIFNLAIFGILLALRGKFQPDGSLFMIYLSSYAAWRIGIDFIRDGNPFFLSLHQAQFVGIIILLITIPLLVRRTRFARIKPAEPIAP